MDKTTYKTKEEKAIYENNEAKEMTSVASCIKINKHGCKGMCKTITIEIDVDVEGLINLVESGKIK